MPPSAGAFFPITGQGDSAQTIAYENKLPTIYLVDSAGVYLPMQDEILDQDDFKGFLSQRPHECCQHSANRSNYGQLCGRCVSSASYV
ncbi:MAG: hypothetical protein R2865_09870 [Deinococcales bacterium]